MIRHQKLSQPDKIVIFLMVFVVFVGESKHLGLWIKRQKRQHRRCVGNLDSDYQVDEKRWNETIVMAYLNLSILICFLSQADYML